MKTLLILVAVVLINGCTSPMLTSEYSEGGTGDITQASTEYLFRKYKVVDNNSNYGLEALTIMDELKRRHPFFKWDLILQGELVLGMNTDEVILSVGRPYDINRSSGGDQWIYGSDIRYRQYLYFNTESELTGYN